MNIKEYKNQLKLELNEYKDKLKEKLNEYKEKLNLKLKKFKEREYKKKNKKSKKTKRKGGAFELTQNNIDLLNSILVNLKIDPSDNDNPIKSQINDVILTIPFLNNCDELKNTLMDLLKNILMLSQGHNKIELNVFMDLINIFNVLLTSNNCDKITLFDFLCYINSISPADKTFLRNEINTVNINNDIEINELKNIINFNIIYTTIIDKLKQDDNTTIISIIELLKNN